MTDRTRIDSEYSRSRREDLNLAKYFIENYDEIMLGASNRAQRIFRYRFGLVDGIMHSRTETAEKFNMTYSSLRSLEFRHFFPSRCHLVRRKKLSDYLDD